MKMVAFKLLVSGAVPLELSRNGFARAATEAMEKALQIECARYRVVLNGMTLDIDNGPGAHTWAPNCESS